MMIQYSCKIITAFLIKLISMTPILDKLIIQNRLWILHLILMIIFHFRIGNSFLIAQIN